MPFIFALFVFFSFPSSFFYLLLHSFFCYYSIMPHIQNSNSSYPTQHTTAKSSRNSFDDYLHLPPPPYTSSSSTINKGNGKKVWISINYASCQSLVNFLLLFKGQRISWPTKWDNTTSFLQQITVCQGLFHKVCIIVWQIDNSSSRLINIPI